MYVHMGVCRRGYENENTYFISRLLVAAAFSRCLSTIHRCLWLNIIAICVKGKYSIAKIVYHAHFFIQRSLLVCCCYWYQCPTETGTDAGQECHSVLQRIYTFSCLFLSPHYCPLHFCILSLSFFYFYIDPNLWYTLALVASLLFLQTLLCFSQHHPAYPFTSLSPLTLLSETNFHK